MNAPSTPPSLPRRAYVVSQFPEFCETFVLNEIVELERRGIPFQVFSLKRCRDTRFQPLARELMERSTHYAPSVFSPSVLVAHVAVAATRPLAYLGCLWLVARSLAGGIAVFSKTLYVFLQAAYFARRARDLNIAHVHAHWASIPSSAGLFIARMAGAGFSLTAHAYDIFIDRTLLAEKIRSARYLVTCTRHNRDFLLKHYPWADPEKVRTFYHGVDLDVFDCAHDAVAEEPTILSIGRLCDTKGFPDLIDACAILRDRGTDFRCRIVGDGPMRRELEERIARLDLCGRVEIAGLMGRDELLDEYRRARLFALPCVVTPRGDRDGLPNVVLEAMAMGLAVVATGVSALGEAVVDGETGRLVPERSPQRFADAIAGLWADAPLRAKMGENARARARKEFGLKECIDRLAAFIHERHK
jgi:colanic acid/amylovoran biosynthesis glycosyltransferase